MATVSIKLGQVIETRDGRQGTVRYIGGLHIAEGEWLGLELPDATGKNDGSVKGEQYFECKQNHGIFVRKESVIEVIRQPPSRPESTTTTSTPSARGRPGGVVSAETARKRQSLMSPASSAIAGSRLSIRSPTKSPVKPPSVTSNVTNTSTTSTPRSTTPATTARTSDSSAKSRLSTTSRQSNAATTTTARSTTHTSRPSISAAVKKPLRPSAVTTKPTVLAKRTSTQTALASRHIQSDSDTEPQTRTRADTIRAPLHNIEDDQHENEAEADDRTGEGEEATQAENTTSPVKTVESSEPMVSTNKSTSISGHANPISHPSGVTTVESRTAQVRELEQLRAKVRSLEKQRQEDREKVLQNEKMQDENDRYKNIIQALQTKLKSNQQELVELRRQHDEIKASATKAPERSAEQESELELATLDKEMAEERAETYQIELETLKVKQEELELELEILREENQELSSVMSPEEKASAGWLQMERERERLREALVMLRDMTQQTEGDLKSEIKELQDNLDEVEATAAKYVETAEKLARSEETNRHLMDQLEAVESNDEVVEAMEAQREQHMQNIEQLRKQIQEFEEHIQVTDELENFHVEEEKRLHAQLDEAGALLNESHRQNLDQDRIIEDLEYTLIKFRDVVQGLQTDIDELRRSRDISEMQANEMSSKSRAMMDLNLRLQNNAAKSQSKTIDSELDKLRADLNAKHVDILSLFTMASFESERNPLLTLLSFRRLQAKAELVSRLLNERLRERPHLTPGEEIFHIFEVIERFLWIARVCQRFDSYMSTCSPDEFVSCGAALQEVEPVERVATGWLEALRRDELGTDGADHIQRMQGVLTDLAEKMITDSNETKATEVLTRTQMIETFSDSIAGQLLALLRIIQSKLGGPVADDEESLAFDKKMDQLSTKAKTIKFLSSKVVRQLTELRSNSMCLDEASWILFEDTEHQAEAIARLVRKIGGAIAEEVSKFEPEQSLNYTNIIEHMASIVHDVQTQGGDVNGSSHDDDAFLVLTARLNNLQSFVDELSVKSGDLNTSIEFEAKTAPWILRSRHLKAQKIIPTDTQEELVRLERRGQELNSRLVEKERTIEEMSMRVELAEKRMKDSKARDDRDKAQSSEVETLKTQRAELEQQLTKLRTELEAYEETVERDRIELETLRKVTNGEVIPIPGSPGIVDDKAMKQMQLEVNLLQTEINAMQAAVRFLRAENHDLRIPTTEILISAAKTTWLKPVLRTGDQESKQESTRQRVDREGQAIYTDLIDIASSLKPVRITTKKSAADSKSTKHGPDTSSWQPVSQTTRYAVLRQREELEKWEDRKTDFVNRAKLVQRTPRPKAILPKMPLHDELSWNNVNGGGPVKPIPTDDTFVTPPDGVQIVET